MGLPGLSAYTLACLEAVLGIMRPPKAKRSGSLARLISTACAVPV